MKGQSYTNYKKEMHVIKALQLNPGAAFKKN
jgi:hypothetical protein